MIKPLLLTLALALVSLTGMFAQSFSWTPEKPLPGEKIRIQYDPSGTPLDGASNIQAVLHVFSGEDMPEAHDLDLRQEGRLYVADFQAPTAANVLFVNWTATGDKNDNNDGKGHKIKLYQPDRSEPVMGLYAQLGVLYGGMSRMIGLEGDSEKAMEYLKKEFARNPAAREQGNNFAWYARLAAQMKDETALAEVRQQIAKLTTKRKATEDDWMMARMLAQPLEDEKQMEDLSATIRKKYPKGKLVKQELVQRFYNSRDIAERESIFGQYRALAAANNKDDQAALSQMAGMIAGRYGAGNWAKFDQYASLTNDKAMLSNTLNSIAWQLCGQGLEGEAQELEKAEQFSRRSLELMDQAIKEGVPASQKYVSPKMWRNNLEYTKANNADTYAVILYRLGKYEEALKYQQMYVDKMEFGNGEGNERYAVYLEKVKGAEPTLELLEKLITANKATEAMKNQYKRLFSSHYTLEQAAAKQLASLEHLAAEEIRRELKGSMLDEEAPAFTLRDLEGQEVSLASLKGKTVVIDFWATWCGPCVASFPGMQMAVDKYKDNPNVVFLFVDTWENADDKKKNASDFITKNNYRFRVLMDEDNKVIGDYKVDGIPTKFILDGNGRIRFKSVGFDGNPDKLLSELSTMIELATEAGKGKAGV